jgi:hypothetical protein
VLAAEDAAYRRSDLSLGEDACRNLVEERLEEVVVHSVHEGHVDWGAPQEAGREESAETTSDDDDSMRAWCTGGV